MCVGGHGSRLPINKLIKHAPILGSRRSAAIIPAPASPLSHGANCSLPPGDHPVTWRNSMTRPPCRRLSGGQSAFSTRPCAGQ